MLLGAPDCVFIILILQQSEIPKAKKKLLN
jgi:hypothetical protein